MSAIEGKIIRDKEVTTRSHDRAKKHQALLETEASVGWSKQRAVWIIEKPATVQWGSQNTLLNRILRSDAALWESFKELFGLPEGRHVFGHSHGINETHRSKKRAATTK